MSEREVEERLNASIVDASAIGDLAKVTLLLITIFLLLLMARPAQARSLGTLTFFTKSKVVGGTINVDDVARLQGVADHELRDRIREIELGRAPTPTTSKTLSRPLIESALRRAGVLDRLKVRFPRRMTVVRPGRRVSANEAEEMIFAALDEFVASSSKEGQTAKVQRGRWSRSLLLPLGELNIVASTKNGTQSSGLTSFRLDFTVDGDVAKTERISVRVSMSGPTCIVTNEMSRGDVLKRDQVQEQVGPLVSGGLSCAEAIGQSARSTLRTGTVLRESQLRAPLLIKRGDPITIIYEVRGLRVRAKGRANRSGALDEWIPVINTSSNKVLRGRVRSYGTVFVN